ncbi:MAG: ribA/ribD-fused uncharacterized protein [Halioglobus sp.]|jgi:ribA/ribD-fused uncharacterized protein
MPLTNKSQDNSVLVSRTDANDVLSTYSRHGFDLDGAHWPSVEHYFQAMKFEDPTEREKVRHAEHPGIARRLGRRRLVRIRRDWSKVRRVIMTRATYTKCRTHAEVAKRLLDTGDRNIVETTLYDYFWGLGRDQRGHNTYGAVLTDVREKLQEEQQ